MTNLTLQKQENSEAARQQRRILLTVAYDGTHYHGFQLQKHRPSVMEALTRAVCKATGEDALLMGASRTDAGVHALGNVAVFDTASSIPAERFCFAINAHLPKDIAVTASREVAADFHPRFQKTVKTYVYKLYNTRTRNPLLDRTAAWVPRPLSLERMKAATAPLVGTQDFASFCSLGSNTGSTVRTVFDLRWQQRESRMAMHITGSGFLYHMVRLIAGMAIQAGSGVLPPEALKAVLERKQRGLAHPVAPARGLTLLSIVYPEEETC